MKVFGSKLKTSSGPFLERKLRNNTHLKRTILFGDNPTGVGMQIYLKKTKTTLIRYLFSGELHLQYHTTRDLVGFHPNAVGRLTNRWPCKRRQKEKENAGSRSQQSKEGSPLGKNHKQYLKINGLSPKSKYSNRQTLQ